MMNGAESCTCINHYAHMLEKGWLYQWFKFIYLMLGIYVASRILIDFDEYPVIVRILAAHIPALIYIFIVDRIPVLMTKVFGANNVLAIVDKRKITLFLEKPFELPLEDLQSIEFGSDSYFKRWQLPFLKNRIKAQYSDRAVVIPTRVDYAPLYRFIHALNRRLPEA